VDAARGILIKIDHNPGDWQPTVFLFCSAATICSRSG
jgi:hypothetical protein